MRFFKLVPVLFLFFVINSCGEEESADEWFAFEEIAPVGDIYYAKDSFRKNDDSIYLHMNGGSYGSLLKKYTFRYVDSKGAINSEMTTVANFSELGFTTPRILDLAVSDCMLRPYAIVSDGTEGTYFVDFTNETKVDIGKYYNYASLRVDECKGYIASHAFMAVGGVLTDSTGSKNISNITGGGFFVYNSTSGNLEIVEDVFDGLGKFSDIFEDANDIRIVSSRGDEVTKFISAIAFINGESRFKILQWYAENGFMDDTTRFAYSLSGLNVNVKTFDYNGTDLSSSVAQFCAVGEDNKSDGYRIYLWNPPTSSGDLPGIETDYPGRCSVTNYFYTDAYANYAYPWSSYNSAKNELSIVWKPFRTNDTKTMLIDKAKSSNWVFATRFNFIAKGSGTSPIMIFYDDNDFLKLAVCKKRQSCTFN